MNKETIMKKVIFLFFILYFIYLIQFIFRLGIEGERNRRKVLTVLIGKRARN